MYAFLMIIMVFETRNNHLWNKVINWGAERIHDMHGLLTTKKKKKTIINACLQASHPLITKQKWEVLRETKRKKKGFKSNISIKFKGGKKIEMQTLY
jgi:hypothetical protein